MGLFDFLKKKKGKESPENEKGEVTALDFDPGEIDPPETRYTQEYADFLASREAAPSDEEKSASSVVCGELTLIPDRMEVLVSGKSVEVTSREFDILLTLAKHPGRIFTREMLLDMLWDYNSFVDERIVDSHIKNLRHKLGGDYIETVRGRGYRIGR